MQLWPRHRPLKMPATRAGKTSLKNYNKRRSENKWNYASVIVNIPKRNFYYVKKIRCVTAHLGTNTLHSDRTCWYSDQLANEWKIEIGLDSNWYLKFIWICWMDQELKTYLMVLSFIRVTKERVKYRHLTSFNMIKSRCCAGPIVYSINSFTVIECRVI